MSAINIHDAFMPIYLSTLRSTLHILTKSHTHLSPSVPDSSILSLRLAPDMNPLTFQVTNICAIARNLIIIVSSPSYFTTQAASYTPAHQSSQSTYSASISGLQQELKDTITLLEGAKRTDFEGRDGAMVEVKALGMKMRGLEYVQEFGVVNLGFHASMVYALFRGQGVQIGKWDYLKGGK